MSSLIFPKLAGLDISVKRTPVFATKIQTSSSGKEQRASFQAFPRYRYELRMNFLRQANSYNTVSDEAATLMNFLAQHRGAWDSFLFADPYDSSDTAMGFGVGNGSTVSFQLQRREPGTYTTVLGTFPVPSTPRTNLILNSNAFSLWITYTGVAVTDNQAVAPNGTVTASRITYNGTGAAGGDRFAGSTNSVVLGTTYTSSIWLRADAPVNLVLENNNGGVLPIQVTTQWQRFSVTSVVTGTPLQVWIHGAASNNAAFTVYAWGGQAESGSSATENITTASSAVTVTPSYYPGTDSFEPVTEIAPGLQVYRQDWQGNQLLYPTPRTNLVKYSEQQSGGIGWNTGTGITGTVDVITAPDGTTTADRLVYNGTGTAGGDRLFSTTAGNTVVGGLYTTSIWLKALAPVTLRMMNDGGSVVINVTTNWQRFSLTVTGTGGANQVWLAGDGSSNAAFTLYAWGAQAETGPVATAYIQTVAAAVTVTDYTLGSNGLITFVTAPASGAVLTWTGGSYRRCRFGGDSAEIEQMLAGAWDGGTIKLISVK